GEPDGRPHIVREYEEGAAVGNDPAVQRHSVDHGTHSVLANAEVEVAPAALRRSEDLAALDVGKVGTREIGGAADQLGHRRSDGVEYRSTGRAAGHVAVARIELRDGALPLYRQIAVPASAQLLGFAWEGLRIL